MNKVFAYFAAKFDRDGIVPASIEASTDKEGNAQYIIKGRIVEMIELSVGIIKGICKKADMDIEDYCEILKDEYIYTEIFNEKDDDDKGLNLFKKMFEDLK